MLLREIKMYADLPITTFELSMQCNRYSKHSLLIHIRQYYLISTDKPTLNSNENFLECPIAIESAIGFLKGTLSSDGWKLTRLIPNCQFYLHFSFDQYKARSFRYGCTFTLTS